MTMMLVSLLGVLSFAEVTDRDFSSTYYHLKRTDVVISKCCEVHEAALTYAPR